MIDRLRSSRQGLGAFRPRLWPTLGAGFVVVSALGLCGWQIQRDGVRNQHLITARAAWELPGVGPEVLADPFQALFRDITLSGSYQEQVMLEGGRRVGGSVGYGVLQVFETDGGQRLLVNRGDLRRADRDEGLAALDHGVPVTLRGQLRPLPESRDDLPIESPNLPPIWGQRHIGDIHVWVGDLAPGIWVWAGERLAEGQYPEPDPLLATGYGPVLRDNTSAHYAKQWLALALIIGALWSWASFEANQKR